MSLYAIWTCDGCGVVIEDAGTNGPEDWVNIQGEDYCAACQQPATATGEAAAAEGTG